VRALNQVDAVKPP
jgi:hypothetical protein